MEEKVIDFEIVSNVDNRFYLKCSWDISDYDENTNDGDWEYEQNDGTFKSHLPRYWTIDGENVSFDFNTKFLFGINWESLKGYILRDCSNGESKTIEFKDYYVLVNGGGNMGINIELDDDFDENYLAKISFKFNGETLLLDYDLREALAEQIDFCYGDYGDYTLCGYNDEFKVELQVSREFIEAGFKNTKEYASLVRQHIEDAYEMYARQLTRDAGIYSRYGDMMEQAIEETLASDKEFLWNFKIALKYDSVEKFLENEGYINNGDD